MFPARRHAPDATLRSVRQDDDCVVPEDLRDRVSIVGEVVLESILKRLVRCLQFDEQKRDAVDESDEIGPLSAVLARNPELRSEKEIVLVGVLPVNDFDRLDSFVVVSGSVGDFDAVFQEFVDFLIRTDRTEDTSVLRHFINSNIQGQRRHAGIEIFECRFESGFKNDLLGRLPA